MTDTPWRPRTLILQHEAGAPPGLIRDWLEEQDAEIDVLRIDEEAREPDPRDYGLIVSLGSEFAAYDDSLHFVPREVRLLRSALDADVPILGICFGGQLLARALGGRGFRAEHSEFGWLPVCTRDPELVTEGPWFQWHFDTFTIPPNATLVADSDVGPQAFISGRNLGLQFHPEVTSEIVDQWVRMFPHELAAAGGEPDAILRETRRLAPAARKSTRRLLDCFRDTIARTGEFG